MRKIGFLSLLLLTSLITYGQDFGLSFSYFIPKNGYFSTPISPFSIRGVGINVNRFISLETGASLYRMSGLNIKDMAFKTKDPILGPNFTLLVPAELVLTLQGGRVSFDVKGGFFGFIPFANRIDFGNLDKAIRFYEGWEVANTTVTDFKKNSIGYGWLTGAELTIYVTQQWGVSFEANYLAGDAAFPIKGSYRGIDDNVITATETFDYKDAKLDLTGLEFSIGVIITSGGGKAKPKPKRRR